MTRGRRRWVRGDRGAVTVEIALAFPVLIVLLLGGLAAVGAVLTKLECVDAAREAARAAARGVPGEAAGRAAAPDGATVAVHADATDVRATVTARVHMFGLALSPLTVTGTAVAAREPGGTA